MCYDQWLYTKRLHYCDVSCKFTYAKRLISSFKLNIIFMGNLVRWIEFMLQENKLFDWWFKTFWLLVLYYRAEYDKFDEVFIINIVDDNVVQIAAIFGNNFLKNSNSCSRIFFYSFYFSTSGTFQSFLWQCHTILCIGVLVKIIIK